ncbi:MAG: Rne/Rng family ribonuclease [Actinobacteria bacterium]|nr:Rne/Rng family ribonuclease [Actinomycetota bacterium]NCA25525.1 Rne/Rng family ribonuclease [Actinomycetota bacterium]NCU77805.1 Rne/Rng family ribonuclease [Actinomycetota bacterium]
MADEPKAPRKRAAKKAASEDKKSTKKSTVIPVPLFQAAPVTKTPKTAKAVKAAPSENLVEKKNSESESEEFRRRRRRGGRGRRRNGKEISDESENDSTENTTDLDSTEVTHKRRRRRRARGEGVVPGETIDEDGVITVVKVREARVRPARSENRNFSRRDRNKFDRPDRRERRDFTRRRGTVITESEFLSRREAVERSMLVRQIADRTQIAIIEDDVMVEHYVNRNSNISYVGNVYLGKVQNVLPSMEAAFVDIGKGRNAVLYAGEVNWDAHGLSDTAPRKIENVLKSGQSVLVQVTKDPIGQKGARLTSQISLPGRYLVYVPGGGMSGISKRLPDNERNRLKSILKNLIPDQAGVIIRTAAEGAPEAELERDVARLKAQWEDIEKKANSSSTSAPSLLYGEPDLTVRVIRDIFNEDFNKMLVQGDQAWDDIQNYIGHIAPELADKIEKWSSNRDLFAENRVEEQLAKAFDRKVYLPSGGSLVIDRTEAMIVIDVNTGKFIGKGGNLEETVTKNNLEAAEEIARQLRLRDMGGIIVIDFIDMTLESNRELVLRRLIECLGRDRTKHQVAEVTSLGLVQMTRKRVGQGLIEAFSTTCESCGGRGIHIHSDPVNKVALEKDLEQRYSKTSKASIEDEDDDHDEIDNHHDVSEVSNSNQDDVVVETAPATTTGRRKGRRAVSTGVISTN